MSNPEVAKPYVLRGSEILDYRDALKAHFGPDYDANDHEQHWEHVGLPNSDDSARVRKQVFTPSRTNGWAGYEPPDYSVSMEPTRLVVPVAVRNMEEERRRILYFVGRGGGGKRGHGRKWRKVSDATTESVLHYFAEWAVEAARIAGAPFPLNASRIGRTSTAFTRRTWAENWRTSRKALAGKLKIADAARLWGVSLRTARRRLAELRSTPYTSVQELFIPRKATSPAPQNRSYPGWEGAAYYTKGIVKAKEESVCTTYRKKR